MMMRSDMDRYLTPYRKYSSLIAMDTKTWEPIAIGSEVYTSDGKKATLVGCERVNEFRYGGRRSGKIAVRWPMDSTSMEYYDNVFGITVIDLETENPVPEGLVS